MTVNDPTGSGAVIAAGNIDHWFPSDTNRNWQAVASGLWPDSIGAQRRRYNFAWLAFL